MPKYNINMETYNETVEKRPDISLTPAELRALYLLREAHVQDLVEVAAMLDDGQRRLAVRMMYAMVEHHRSMLS